MVMAQASEKAIIAQLVQLTHSPRQPLQMLTKLNQKPSARQIMNRNVFMLDSPFAVCKSEEVGNWFGSVTGTK